MTVEALKGMIRHPIVCLGTRFFWIAAFATMLPVVIFTHEIKNSGFGAQEVHLLRATFSFIMTFPLVTIATPALHYLKYPVLIVPTIFSAFILNCLFWGAVIHALSHIIRRRIDT